MKTIHKGIATLPAIALAIVGAFIIVFFAVPLVKTVTIQPQCITTPCDPIITRTTIAKHIFSGKKNVDEQLGQDQQSQHKTVNQLSVDGMSQYVDSEFGYSFWYPKSWNLKNENENSVGVEPSDYPGEGIWIQEITTSSEKGYRDNSNCGPADACPSGIRYYYDDSRKSWMKDSYFEYGADTGMQATAKTAQASTMLNSMGGLPIFGGNARHGANMIVPLTPTKFLVLQAMSPGGIFLDPLAKTIMALDPSIATPASRSEQEKTIRAEGILYGALGTGVGGAWYVDSTNVYNHRGDIIPGANPSTFKIINYSDGTPSASYATDGTYVYSGWLNGAVLSGADPATFIPIKQEYQIPFAQSSGKYGQSFTSTDTEFAKDKSHVWYRSVLIPDADPSTFVVTGNIHVKNSQGSYTVAHDAKHVYAETEQNTIVIVQ